MDVEEILLTAAHFEDALEDVDPRTVGEFGTGTFEEVDADEFTTDA